MPADFTTLVDDDGSNTVGTLIFKADLQALLMGAVITNAGSGSINNAAPAGMAGHTFCVWSGAADVTWTGLAGGVSGQLFLFKNATTTKIATFPHNSGSSSAGNKFFNYATSAATPVGPSGHIAWRHDGTQWQIVSHEQGAWITPTHADANYTGNGAMTWTVTSGDVGACRYRLRGRDLLVQFQLLSTSVAGTPNTTLQIGNAAWGGFTLASLTSFTPTGFATEPTTGNLVAYLTPVSTTLLGFIKLVTGNWTASTNNTYVYGTGHLEVT